MTIFHCLLASLLLSTTHSYPQTQQESLQDVSEQDFPVDDGRGGDQWWRNYEVIEDQANDFEDNLEMVYMYKANPSQFTTTRLSNRARAYRPTTSSTPKPLPSTTPPHRKPSKKTVTPPSTITDFLFRTTTFTPESDIFASRTAIQSPVTTFQDSRDTSSPDAFSKPTTAHRVRVKKRKQSTHLPKQLISEQTPSATAAPSYLAADNARIEAITKEIGTSSPAPLPSNPYLSAVQPAAVSIPRYAGLLNRYSLLDGVSAIGDLNSASSEQNNRSQLTDNAEVGRRVRQPFASQPASTRNFDGFEDTFRATERPKRRRQKQTTSIPNVALHSSDAFVSKQPQEPQAIPAQIASGQSPLFSRTRNAGQFRQLSTPISHPPPFVYSSDTSPTVSPVTTTLPPDSLFNAEPLTKQIPATQPLFSSRGRKKVSTTQQHNASPATTVSSFEARTPESVLTDTSTRTSISPSRPASTRIIPRPRRLGFTPSFITDNSATDPFPPLPQSEGLPVQQPVHVITKDLENPTYQIKNEPSNNYNDSLKLDSNQPSDAANLQIPNEEGITGISRKFLLRKTHPTTSGLARSRIPSSTLSLTTSNRFPSTTSRPFSATGASPTTFDVNRGRPYHQESTSTVINENLNPATSFNATFLRPTETIKRGQPFKFKARTFGHTSSENVPTSSEINIISTTEATSTISQKEAFQPRQSTSSRFLNRSRGTPFITRTTQGSPISTSTASAVNLPSVSSTIKSPLEQPSRGFISRSPSRNRIPSLRTDLNLQNSTASYIGSAQHHPFNFPASTPSFVQSSPAILPSNSYDISVTDRFARPRQETPPQFKPVGLAPHTAVVQDTTSSPGRSAEINPISQGNKLAFTPSGTSRNLFKARSSTRTPKANLTSSDAYTRELPADIATVTPISPLTQQNDTVLEQTISDRHFGGKRRRRPFSREPTFVTPSEAFTSGSLASRSSANVPDVTTSTEANHPLHEDSNVPMFPFPPRPQYQDRHSNENHHYVASEIPPQVTGAQRQFRRRKIRQRSTQSFSDELLHKSSTNEYQTSPITQWAISTKSSATLPITTATVSTTSDIPNSTDKINTISPNDLKALKDILTSKGKAFKLANKSKHSTTIPSSTPSQWSNTEDILAMAADESAAEAAGLWFLDSNKDDGKIGNMKIEQSNPFLSSSLGKEISSPLWFNLDGELSHNDDETSTAPLEPIKKNVTFSVSSSSSHESEKPSDVGIDSGNDQVPESNGNSDINQSKSSTFSVSSSMSVHTETSKTDSESMTNDKSSSDISENEEKGNIDTVDSDLERGPPKLIIIDRKTLGEENNGHEITKGRGEEQTEIEVTTISIEPVTKENLPEVTKASRQRGGDSTSSRNREAKSKAVDQTRRPSTVRDRSRSRTTPSKATTTSTMKAVVDTTTESVNLTEIELTTQISKSSSDEIGYFGEEEVVPVEHGSFDEPDEHELKVKDAEEPSESERDGADIEVASVDVSEHTDPNERETSPLELSPSFQVEVKSLAPEALQIAMSKEITNETYSALADILKIHRKVQVLKKAHSRLPKLERDTELSNSRNFFRSDNLKENVLDNARIVHSAGISDENVTATAKNSSVSSEDSESFSTTGRTMRYQSNETAENGRYSNTFKEAKNCTRKDQNICTTLEDYPVELVKSLINEHDTKLLELYKALNGDYKGSPSSLYPEDSLKQQGDLSVCDSTIEEVRPGWAREAESGQWMIVINAEAFQQKIRIESCLRPKSACLFISPYYKSSCIEHYSIHRLIAMDPHNLTEGPAVHLFKFPCGCSCKVETLHKQN